MAFAVIGVVGVVLLVLALGVGDLLDGALDTIDVFDTGWLSTAAIGGFLGALGLVGWAVEPSAGPTIATLAAWPQVCSLAASPGGWPGRSRPAATDGGRRGSDLVGLEATVLTPIAAGGYGEVALRVSGQVIKLGARADRPMPANARVWVIEVLSPTAVRVEPVDELEGPAGSLPA